LLGVDDHTADAPENGPVRGAAELLLRMPEIPKPARLRLLRVRATLEEVGPARPSPSVRAPEVTRLNARYAGALALAELILRGTSLTTLGGQLESAALVLDMNKVFEDFLSTALRAALERHGGRVRFQYNARHLDKAARFTFKPDITRSARRPLPRGDRRQVQGARCVRHPECRRLPDTCLLRRVRTDCGHLVYAKDAGQEPLDHVVSGRELAGWTDNSTRRTAR
jgi:5-methylcytosine-specific restriction enzyme subunit McrC